VADVVVVATVVVAVVVGVVVVAVVGIVVTAIFAVVVAAVTFAVSEPVILFSVAVCNTVGKTVVSVEKSV